MPVCHGGKPALKAGICLVASSGETSRGLQRLPIALVSSLPPRPCYRHDVAE